MAQSWVQLRFTVHLQMYEQKCTIELRMRGSSKKGFPSFHLFNLLSATGSHTTIQNAFAVGARAVLPDLNREESDLTFVSFVCFCHVQQVSVAPFIWVSSCA